VWLLVTLVSKKIAPKATHYTAHCANCFPLHIHHRPPPLFSFSKGARAYKPPLDHMVAKRHTYSSLGVTRAYLCTWKLTTQPPGGGDLAIVRPKNFLSVRSDIGRVSLNRYIGVKRDGGYACFNASSTLHERVVSVFWFTWTPHGNPVNVQRYELAYHLRTLLRWRFSILPQRIENAVILLYLKG
jgi:hypothetical protein